MTGWCEQKISHRVGTLDEELQVTDDCQKWENLLPTVVIPFVGMMEGRVPLCCRLTALLRVLTSKA